LELRETPEVKAISEKVKVKMPMRPQSCQHHIRTRVGVADAASFSTDVLKLEDLHLMSIAGILKR